MGAEMKLAKSGSVFNMGDTSIRVQEVVEVNRLILKVLNGFINRIPKWERNNSAQAEFYKLFISEVQRLEEKSGTGLFQNLSRNLRGSDLDKRGRTLTNAIVKSGLIDDRRNVSKVAKVYLEENLKADSIEELLGLSQDNLLYFRQYMKLRVYDSETDKYFYCFRFALKFLCRYENVNKKHFFSILESIRPNISQEKLKRVLESYEDVVSERSTFESYWKKNFFNDFIDKDDSLFVRQMFENEDYSDENFIRAFPNRKSSEISLEYKKFILSIFDFLANRSVESLSRLKRLSTVDKIKKAFGLGKNPFNFSRNKETVESFWNNNKDNRLLSGNYEDIYNQFILSKTEDIIREYSDMCYRYFNITGIINFSNDLVNLNFRYIIKPLLDNLGEKFKLIGVSPREEYELNLESPWFSNIALTRILALSKDEIKKIFEDIGSCLGISTDKLDDNLPLVVENQRESEYRTFIEKRFPINIVIDILNYIKNRDDSQVARLVTEEATIPTIYEYILTIAWYYLSDKKDFKVYKMFGVSLDGNKLPLVHKGGGAGDIEVVTDSNATLIEATLMDSNTQKRGELEPVIRHSVNFALQHKSKQVQTIFIANELDPNVINIFRSIKNVELNGTLIEGTYLGLNIFSFTTDELIQLLDKKISSETVLEVLEKFNKEEIDVIRNDWRIPIIKHLLT